MGLEISGKTLTYLKLIASFIVLSYIYYYPLFIVSSVTQMLLKVFSTLLNNGALSH